MNRRLKWLLMLSLAAVGVLWFIGGRLRAADEESAPHDDRVAELEARVEALEQEIASLKQQMAEGQAEWTRVNPTETLLVPQFPNADPRQRTPAGEINGVPYYHFLLNGDAASR
jgi:hypothetical protein